MIAGIISECAVFSLLEPVGEMGGHVFDGDAFTFQWFSLAWILGLATVGAMSRIWKDSPDERTQQDRGGARTALSMAVLTPIPLLLFDYVVFVGLRISPVRMHGIAAGVYSLLWIPVCLGLVVAPLALLSGLRGSKDIGS